MLLPKLFIKIKKIGNILDKVDEVLYPVFGLHSYETYLEHFKKAHPDQKPLSRVEFFRQSQDAKGKESRC